eukprot:354287-Chlamydomonas_euryale.AAC.1
MQCVRLLLLWCATNNSTKCTNRLLVAVSSCQMCRHRSRSVLGRGNWVLQAPCKLEVTDQYTCILNLSCPSSSHTPLHGSTLHTRERDANAPCNSKHFKPLGTDTSCRHVVIPGACECSASGSCVQCACMCRAAVPSLTVGQAVPFAKLQSGTGAASTFRLGAACGSGADAEDRRPSAALTSQKPALAVTAVAAAAAVQRRAHS